jgi:glutamyl-tRNA reductase
VLRGRRNRPLFLIDIAIPRDVDPAVGDLDSAFLYNIDDLQAVVRENLTRRSAEVARAETIVADEVRKFETWLTTRVAIPTVVALRQRFEAIRRTELDRLQPKLAGLPPEAKTRVEEITRLLIEKLLITPTEQLKSTPDPERVRTYADALTRLFALDAEEPARGEPGRVPAAQRGGEPGSR